MTKPVRYLLFLIFCLFTIYFLTQESDGLVVKMQISKGQARARNIFYIKKGNFKIVTDKRTLIFTENCLSLIDHKEKTYWSGSIKEFNKGLMEIRSDLTGSYSATSNLFYESLSEKDKEFFRNVNETITGRIKGDPKTCEVLSTPNFISIAGYASRKYEIRQDKNLIEEVWVAENLKNYLNYELDFELYESFLNSFLLHSQSKLHDHLKPFMEVVENGFPMKVKMYGKGNVTETVVENLIKRELDDSMFQVSQGYDFRDLKFLLD